jgi:hypothetical protein
MGEYEPDRIGVSGAPHRKVHESPFFRQKKYKEQAFFYERGLRIGYDF